MKQEKILFIDRDGTLIVEPEDKQIDSIEKLDFLPGVFTALAQLQRAGYKLVMISNQDGLGTVSFPLDTFTPPHELMLKIFNSQRITFADIRICPHLPQDNCECRKPKLGLVLDYLQEQVIDRDNSFVIGDRDSDLALAKNLGIAGIKLGQANITTWEDIVGLILDAPRMATIKRKTNETDIMVSVNLDATNPIQIDTGIGFFDHMLEQLVKHANISATIKVTGDLEIDDHHTVEDTALALGSALKKALGDKRGISRYGFILPMDEAQAQIAIDLSGRAFCEFSPHFDRDEVGEMSTEMISHFFRSLADALQATLHIQANGTNTHHVIEAIFKGTGRTLRQAFVRDSVELPSTKGVL